jgi:hypothetical protein
VELNEEELVRLIQLVTADMVAEVGKQPPLVDYKASLSDLAKKLHKAREEEMMMRLKNNHGSPRS